MRALTPIAVPFVLFTMFSGCLLPKDEGPADPGDTAKFAEPADLPRATTLARAGDAGPDAAATGASAMTRWNWTLVDCSYAFGLAPVETARIQALVPAGFVVGGAVAMVGFETDVCASGAGANGTVTPMSYASVWVVAQPPPHLRVPGVPLGAHFVNFDVLIPDAERRDAMAAAGLPARNGSIHETATPGLTTIVTSLDDLGEIRFEIIGGAPNPTGLLGVFAQYTESENGTLARWKTAYGATAVRAAVGTIALPAGSWLAELFGSEEVPARFSLGRWSYTDGFVEFPITA